MSTTNDESSSDQLQILTEFERRLAAVTTVGEAKKLRDEAETFRYYAKTARKGIEAQNRCAAARFLAERKVGEMLAKMPRASGPGRGKKNEAAAKSFLKMLEAEGIPYGFAQMWQDWAQVPEAEFRKFLVLEDGGELNAVWLA